MRRIVTTVLAALGTIVVPATLAGATPPQITPGESFEAAIPFPDVCDFPLTATVRGRQHTIVFVDASGTPVSGILSGQLFVTWTRDDTGFSRTFSISGPGFLDTEGNQIHGVGRWTTPMVDVGWVLASGNLTLNGTQDGFALIESVSGHVQSICDLLS
jgi:hypothetical protein